MTIKNRYFYFLGIFVCKCLNNIAPFSLVDCFHVMDDSQLYTRTVSNKGLIIPHPNLSICKSVLFIFKQVLKTVYNNQTDSLHSFEASVTIVFFFSPGLQCGRVIF